MKIRLTLLAVAFATAPFLMTGPLVAAPTAVEGNDSFRMRINLTQAAVGDQGVKLSPGIYDIDFTMMGDGSVRATFFQGGVRKGEANGIVVINSRPAAGKAPTFSSLGLHTASPHAFTPVGGKLNLQVGAPGSNKILIGLLLPAVQTNAIASPRDPKLNAPVDGKIQAPGVQPGK